MKLLLKVVPLSSEDCISGWLDKRLKIKVKAVPEKGKANKAVTMLLEKSLGLNKGNVEIIQGHRSTFKTVEINSLSKAQVLRLLA